MAHDPTKHAAPWSSQDVNWLLDEAQRILDSASNLPPGADPGYLIAMAQVHVAAAQIRVVQDIDWTLNNLLSPQHNH